VLSRRDEAGQWIPPSYVRLVGGSFGPQLGFQVTDLILVFTDRKAVEALLKGKLTLGAGASAAAGPVGRDASIGTDVLLRSAIYSYSRSRGLFAGITLNAATVTIDDRGNRDAYSGKFTGDDVLKDRVVYSNVVVQPFIDSLNDATQTSQAGASAADASNADTDPSAAK
jgi:lipid-binding SYLF domain-containing protein